MSANLPAESDPEKDGLDAPLRFKSDALPITTFLNSHPGTEHPSQEIFLKDLKPEGRPAEGDGALRIGQGDTLQVKSGPDWLAVESYPERFQLTEASVAAIRVSTKKDALAAVEGRTPEVDDWIVGARPVARTAPREDPRDVFYRELTRAIGYGTKKKLNDDKVLVIGCQTAGETEKLLLQARRAIFTLDLYFTDRSHRKTVRGTDDPSIQHLLAKTLPKGYLEDMAYADRDHDGPYALLFDPDDEALIIYCKELAIQRQIR